MAREPEGRPLRQADELAPGIHGRLAVVTGGGRGLGKAVEARGQRAFTARADARRPGEMAGFVDQAASALGGIDLLVNSVGVFRKTPLESLEEEAMDEAFAVNVKAAVMAVDGGREHF